MSAGWVAGSVRARALARSRMDSGVARRVAAQILAALADARQARELAELVGSAALTPLDQQHLRLEAAFEAQLENQTAAEWDRCCACAERWLLRASRLGGERAIRLGAAGSAADVTIRYAVTMGVRHPDGADGVTCRIPESASWDRPALAAAREAHGRALGGRGQARRRSRRAAGRRGRGARHPVPAPRRQEPLDPAPGAGAGRRDPRPGGARARRLRPAAPVRAIRPGGRAVEVTLGPKGLRAREQRP